MDCDLLPAGAVTNPDEADPTAVGVAPVGVTPVGVTTRGVGAGVTVVDSSFLEQPAAINSCDPVTASTATDTITRPIEVLIPVGSAKV